MSFDVPAEAYGRFMGRFSEPLAVLFADWAGVREAQQVLDVGCGPGALTAELVRRVGAAHVAAVDPSTPFVAAAQARFPEVDIRVAGAEALPFADDSVDAALAQLVVQFMTDPAAGLAEMRRVTRPGGRVAACVWDHSGDSGPLSPFWRAARDLDPGVEDESRGVGVREGDLERLCEAAGLGDVEGGRLTVRVVMPTFDAWWEPFTLGVGPAGAHVTSLDDAGREALRERCAQLFPLSAGGPFEVAASAWCVRAAA